MASDQERLLRDDFAPLIEHLGFRIVELHCATVHGRIHLDIVIHAADGVTIDDCADVHKLIRPRAEVMLDSRDVAVQIASPGINRVLKDNSEFDVFAGSPVLILRRSDEDWIAGVIRRTDESSVTIDSSDGEMTLAFDDIQKAKLE